MGPFKRTREEGRLKLHYGATGNTSYHMSVRRHTAAIPLKKTTGKKHSHFGNVSRLRVHSNTDRRQAYIDFSMRPTFGDGESLHKHWVASLRFIPACALAATCGRGIPFQQARGHSDLISYAFNTERINRAAALSLVH
jgi:hypothetical protein